MTQTARKIEFVAVADLLKRQAKRNPKDHDIGALSESIKRHGFVEPIVVDKRTGLMVAGHGRLEALAAMAKDGEAPPDGVHVVDGEWRVPVVAGWESKNDAQAEAYIIASNRIMELGGWNQESLNQLLLDLAKKDELEGSGFDADDVDRLLAALPPQGGPPTDASAEWVDMVDFSPDKHVFRKIVVNFADAKALIEFEKALGIEIPDKMRYIWFPPKEKEVSADKRVTDG